MDLLLHVFGYCKDFPGQLSQALTGCLHPKAKGDAAGYIPPSSSRKSSFFAVSLRPAGQPAQLLNLPPHLLAEILSWCSSEASAAAVLATCRELRALRRRPHAAAALLLRSPCFCRHFTGPLRLGAATGAWRRSSLPVAAAVLALLQAAPDGSPSSYTASTELMQDVLLCVAHHRAAPLVQQVLTLCPPPNLTQDGGSALLVMVVAAGDVHTATLLLDAGADAAAHCGLSQTPLRQAVAAGTPTACLLLLLRRCPTDRLHWARTYAAVYAAREGNVPALRHLLPLPGSAPPGDLLMHGASHGRLNVVQLLLTGDASDFLGEYETGRALGLACRHGQTACAEALLDFGAGMSHIDEASLKEVVAKRYTGLMQMLVRRGIVVRAKCRAGSCQERYVLAGFEGAGTSSLFTLAWPQQ